MFVEYISASSMTRFDTEDGNGRAAMLTAQLVLEAVLRFDTEDGNGRAAIGKPIMKMSNNFKFRYRRR